MKFEFPAIYPITDTRLSGLSHAEQVEKLAAGGATLIQLREKNATPREFFEQAVAVIHLAHKRNVRIIINDRVDIALCAGADGVHLGQEDMPPDAARRLLGADAIIGFSTHNAEQARAATEMPISYVAIGPVFETSTKEDPDEVVGLGGLQEVRSIVGDLPLVAIGGLNMQNLGSVLAAGADSVAIISALFEGDGDIDRNYKTLRSAALNK